MGKFNGILICTDLDGTLLRKVQRISRENDGSLRLPKQGALVEL